MQVTCPNCRARYAVDPLAIGPSGRTVQCARCSERWFEMVKVEPPPEVPPVPPPAAAAAAPEVADAREPAAPRRAAAKAGFLSWLSPKSKAKGAPKSSGAKADAKVDAGIDAGADGNSGPNADQESASETLARSAARAAARAAVFKPAPDFVIRPASRGAMLPALIEPKADRGMSLMLVGTLVVLLLVAAGLLAFHNVIADMLPSEWRSILRFNA
jgi:predicted Zn finger-like uncharacterized protein